MGSPDASRLRLLKTLSRAVSLHTHTAHSFTLTQTHSQTQSHTHTHLTECLESRRRPGQLGTPKAMHQQISASSARNRRKPLNGTCVGRFFRHGECSHQVVAGRFAPFFATRQHRSTCRAWHGPRGLDHRGLHVGMAPLRRCWRLHGLQHPRRREPWRMGIDSWPLCHVSCAI
jgi:hypothetical protein